MSGHIFYVTERNRDWLRIYMSRTKASKCFFLSFFLSSSSSSSSSFGTYILHHWVLFIGVLWAPVRPIYVFVWAQPFFNFDIMIPTWATKEQGYMPCMNIVARPMEYDTQGMQTESREGDGRWQDHNTLPSCILFFTIELNIYIYMKEGQFFSCVGDLIY